MATADATHFPVRGQAFRTGAVIRSTSTGNPITGGLTTPTGSVSIDGAAFTSTGVTVTEIGTTGYVTVDIDATRMTGNLIILKVTAANANAHEAAAIIQPLDLSELSDHWKDQSVDRLEQGLVQLIGWFFSEQRRNKATGEQTLYNASGSALGTLAFTDDGTSEIKGKFGG